VDGRLNRNRLLLASNQLGSIFDELKTMDDARAAILGLEALVGTLREARLERERGADIVRVKAQTLIAELAPLDVERVAAVLALRPRTSDLDGIGVAHAGEWDAFDPAGELALLRALASLRTTDAATMSSALGEVAAVQEAVESLAGSDAERAGEPRTCCRPPAVANRRRSCLDSHHGEVDSR
jgi:hypothetical protein